MKCYYVTPISTTYDRDTMVSPNILTLKIVINIFSVFQERRIQFAINFSIAQAA